MTDVRTAARPRARGSELARAFDVQCKVIGALLMRELHTRFGRDNIGYLWLFGEPMLLAGAVSIIHSQYHTRYSPDINPVSLGVVGYTMFIMFRGMVNRAEGTLESNMPLLYHRSVTIFDMMLARAILEAVSCFVTFLVLIALCTVINYATLPVRPLQLLIGVGLIAWWSWVWSLIVCAITHDRPIVARFVHPIVYILMPISGAFFTMSWLPPVLRNALEWFPMSLIFEQLRYGQFQSASTQYIANGYVAGWCLILTYVGLLAIKITRRHVHLR